MTTKTKKNPAEAKKQQQYAAHRRQTAKRQADLAEAGQEIGSPPAVVNPKRRKRCERNFRFFCETYFSKVFYLPWSPDHLRAIKKIEHAVLKGRLFALAMPRGSGKTWLMLCAVMWAVLYGHHEFVTLIASTERRARQLLRRIYNHFERNKLLYDDFPEVCFPVRCLERTPQRAGKQKSDGEYTSMVWTTNEIILPTIDGSKSSGTIITVCGLTGGEVRGQTRDMPDGSAARPSLALLDDPQTKKSAKSKTQTAERIELLQGDVLGMAGPDKNIAGMMTCTVIEPGDMADQVLDSDINPEWHGERTQMVYSWPANEPLWEEYTTLRAEGLRKRDGGAAATEMYRKNRKAMDVGVKVAWKARFPGDCLSAIQFAVNLRMRNEAAFFAEYQNEPLTDDAADDLLTAEQISEKTNRRAHATIPTSCNHLVMYIDVHKRLLFYVVIALEDDYTSYIVDYGAYPDPKKRYYSMRQCRSTLLTAARGVGEEGAIRAGLEKLTEAKLGAEWTRDDGAAMNISLCLIDSGYQKDTVEQFVRETKYAGRILSAKGMPITASNIPLNERKGKKGEKRGDEWKLTGAQGSHSVRLLELDTNHWKSFVHARLATAIGDKGCMSFFGKSSARHRLISEHFTAEYRVHTEGRGRKLSEWKAPPHRPDNHFFDCTVGCMVAASMLGCRLLGSVLKKTKKRGRSRRKKATYF